MPEQANNHNYNSYQEHKKGNTVHSVHELETGIVWFIGIALAEIKISKDLLPETLFHVTS